MKSIIYSLFATTAIVVVVQGQETTYAAAETLPPMATYAPTPLPFLSQSYSVWTSAAPSDFVDAVTGDSFSDLFEYTSICYQPDYTVESGVTYPPIEHTNNRPSPATIPPPAVSSDYVATSSFYLPTSGLFNWWTTTTVEGHAQATSPPVPAPVTSAPRPVARPPAVTPAPRPNRRRQAGTTAGTYPEQVTIQNTVPPPVFDGSSDDNYAPATTAAYYSWSGTTETYSQYHRIAVGTTAKTNTAWIKRLTQALGLDKGELRDPSRFSNANGEQLFVFGLGSGNDDRFCYVHGQLSALDSYTAADLQLGGVDTVYVAVDAQFDKDDDPSDASSLMISVSLIMCLLATLF